MQKNSESFEKVGCVYILLIFLNTLCLLGTLFFWCYEHIQIEISNYKKFTFSIWFTIGFIIIYILHVIIVKNEGKILKFFGFVFIIVLIVFNMNYIEINVTSYQNTHLYILLILFLFLVYAYIFITYERKRLILEIQSLIFSCNNDNNLSDLIDHYDSALKKAKKAKRLLAFGRDKMIIESYLDTLINSEQHYIKNVILNNYNDIVKSIEIQNIYLSSLIYVNCKKIISSINLYINRFDKCNMELGSLILEKSCLIMNFTEKYIHAYNVDTQYNIDLMNGQEFERYCANLLIAYGFKNIEVTKGSGDQGVDIIGYYNGFKYAIQCKRYSKKLGNSPIQEVAAGKNFYNCQNAMVITNNYFTDGAIQLAEANDVVLWDRNKLMQVIYYTDNQWDELLEKIRI